VESRTLQVCVRDPRAFLNTLVSDLVEQLSAVWYCECSSTVGSGCRLPGTRTLWRSPLERRQTATVVQGSQREPRSLTTKNLFRNRWVSATTNTGHDCFLPVAFEAIIEITVRDHW